MATFTLTLILRVPSGVKTAKNVTLIPAKLLATMHCGGYSRGEPRMAGDF